MNKLIFLLVATFLVSFSLKASDAEVLFVDSSVDTIFSQQVPIFNLTLPPTSGQPGEYEILACVTQDGGNFFTGATPNWNDLILGDCGGPNCILGIWNKFSPEPNDANTVCSWNVGTAPRRAAGAVLRYSGVDSNAPVFDSACNLGIGRIATAPSVNTLDGSMVVRIFGSNVSVLLSFSELPGSREFGKVLIETGIQDAAVIFAYGEPFENGGITEEVSIQYELVDTAWRACTISLRMEGSRVGVGVPTLNEWGLIAMAGVLGIVGFMVMRRRKVTA